MSELKLENVKYRYRGADTDVLKGISCTFESGKIYALVGPSGSGKSTLLSLMAGLDHPSEGQVLLDGTPLSAMNLDVYRRKDVSVIFQAFQLFPYLTVEENVCFPMETGGIHTKEARKEAKNLLERVGITAEKHKRYPAKLSGGEQQRVAIARALSTGAGLLLADEPTGNLDTENTNQIMQILLTLAHTDNRCVIVVTHDLELAAQADQVYRIRDGILMPES